MKMLQLTDTQGNAMYVNPTHIIYFHKSGIDGRTVINMNNTPYVWRVKESPEEIMAMLANLREGE